MDNEFLKRWHYLRRERKGWGGSFTGAVAIRTPSCQDCSKAGAAEVDIMQHMLAESNHLNFPRGSSHLGHTEKMQVSSVVRRKLKQELLEIPTPPPLMRGPWPCIIKKQKNTSTSLELGLKINKRKLGPRLSDNRLESSPQCTLSTESHCSMRLQST